MKGVVPDVARDEALQARRHSLVEVKGNSVAVFFIPSRGHGVAAGKVTAGAQERLPKPLDQSADARGMCGGKHG